MMKEAKNQQGQILLNVLIVLGVIAAVSGFIAEHGQFIQGMSGRTRVKSVMMLTEVKIKNIMLQPYSYDSSTCVESNVYNAATGKNEIKQECDLVPNLFNNIDPSGIVTVSTPSYNKTTGEFSVDILPVDNSFIQKRTVAFTVPTNISKVSTWTCPKERPVFRGFDINGSPRCEPLYDAKCDKKRFVSGLDQSILHVQCNSIQTEIKCPPNQIIMDYAWAGGEKDKSNPVPEPDNFSLNCGDPKSLTDLFGFVPDVSQTVPAMVPEVLVATTPQPGSDSVVELGPSTLPACTSWSQVVAMQGAGCQNLRTAPTYPQPFQCLPPDAGNKIYACQECQTSPGVYRMVAVRTCGSASAWEELAGVGTGTAPIHDMGCTSNGQIVEDGKELCLNGTTTVRKKYVCKPDGTGALKLTDPPVGTPAYVDNLVYMAASDYKVTSCH